MKTRDFSFDLPGELIAQHPAAVRGTSRLLVTDRTNNTTIHATMGDIAGFLPEGAVLVFNDSRVRKARVYAKSIHGGTVELLLVKNTKPRTWRVLTSKARRQRVGKEYELPGDVLGTVIGVEPPFRIVEFSREITEGWLDLHGHVPLPPYIERPDESVDAERYQTIYSRQTGSVAAPTAGLHFTEEILSGIRAKGIEIKFVTLHVGAGTFFPIRSEKIEDHTMHEEEYEISASCAADLNRAASEGRPIISVGTTSLRSLEAASADGAVKPGKATTSIFIQPGYRFRTVTGMFTNFHTPESTLLVLVSAFAGTEKIKGIYQEAIAERYRFFSYGDAMLIL